MRKAKQLLGERPHTELKYYKARPSVAEVRELAAITPGGARTLVSTKSQRYKQLGLDLAALGEEQLLELLCQEPGLWRRPVVRKGNQVIVGYDEAALRALLDS